MITTFTLKDIQFNSPIFLASGTVAFGERVIPGLKNKPGALITKAITYEPRPGNAPPRIMETPCGLINSIGLKNPGVESFTETTCKEIKEYGVPIIVNIAGSTLSEYKKVLEMIENKCEIDAYEINISCPNVRAGGMAFGTDYKITGELISSLRSLTQKPIIVKLSPNAGIVEILKVAEAAILSGANALSLINTLVGMVVDIKNKKPVLGGVSGGLSGPAIKPVGVYYTYLIRKHFPDVPIIGIGGILNGEDVIEYLMAGANAVQIGSASLIDPQAYDKIYEEFIQYMKKNEIEDYNDLIDIVHRRG